MSAIGDQQRGRRWSVLVLFLAIVYAVAVLSGLVTAPKIAGWYAHLAKPSFSPPDWVFRPVWIILHALMAIAAWRVWTAFAEPAKKRQAMIWFAVQLALRAAWSSVFFVLERPGLALLVIVAQLAAIAVTLWRFSIIDRVAGFLLVPYLSWVAFTALLDAAIVALN
jgi:benzodiazapine receptor